MKTKYFLAGSLLLIAPAVGVIQRASGTVNNRITVTAPKPLPMPTPDGPPGSGIPCPPCGPYGDDISFSTNTLHR